MDKIENNHTMGSVLRVALPLIFSSFSWTLMITIDRMMLAQYSLDEMNAVVAIGTLLFMFEWSISSITVTSEIFAGQFNGLKRKKKTPIATWQMLILSAGSSILFIPTSLFLGKYLIPEKYYIHGGDFFQIIMCFLMFGAANNAINAFFIGIKKTKIILYNAIFGNIINIILSYNLIFGIEGFVDPLGSKGAAIATTIALIIQFSIIFSVFLSKKIDREYSTREFILDSDIFKKCLKLGIPSSIGLIAEMSGNYMMQILILAYLPIYVSNHNITINIYVFLTFLLNGMHKAISGLAANLIGEDRIKQIDKLLVSGIKLHMFSTLIVIIPTIIFGNFTASLYTDNIDIINNTVQTFRWLAVTFFLEGVGWIIAGAIIAGGDTKFNMLTNIIVIWVFKVVPTYLLLKNNVSAVALGWMVSTCSNIIYVILFYMRYKSGKWLKLRLS